MAPITSDCGTVCSPPHQMALITTGCVPCRLIELTNPAAELPNFYAYYAQPVPVGATEFAPATIFDMCRVGSAVGETAI